MIPVHFYGQPADMDPIIELARKYELFVVEDACQAHGAEYKGRRAGSMGDAGCFSFYPGKNLGAYGEAGAVVTDNGELAEKLRMFRDHGQPKRYYHDLVGWNGRMDGFQGAVLSVKLNYLEDWNKGRRKNAALYRKYLAGVEGIMLPQEAEYARHVYHLYPIRVKNRDRVMEALAEKEIYCGIHYPVPVHLQKAYEFLGHKQGDFPVTEKIASELLSLPMFPELTEEQIEYVADSLKDILKNITFISHRAHRDRQTEQRTGLTGLTCSFARLRGQSEKQKLAPASQRDQATFRWPTVGSDKAFLQETSTFVIR